jgi:lipopolysaccharide biosynthesis regulator YciM
MAKGKLELGNGEYRQALATLIQVESQNPRYLPVVLPLIRQCWERLGNDQLTDYLQHLHEDFGIISAAVELAQGIRGAQGLGAAIDYLLPILEANPDPLAISRVLALLAEDGGPGSGRMRRLCGLLQALMARKLRFQCEQCGFSVSELYWRCPSCQYWGSIMPLDYGAAWTEM